MLEGEEIRCRVENSYGLERWAAFLIDGVQRLGQGSENILGKMI